MKRLNFEYCDSANESRAEYRGLRIVAIQDESPSNPWTDSDGLSPLLWTAGDGMTEYGDADLQRPLAAFSDYQISRKWRQLVAIVAPDANADAISAELAKARRDNAPQWRASLAELKRETLEERLAEEAPSERGRAWPVDYMESLAELWTLAGVDCLSFQRNGYSQGDSVLGLLVATPAWRKAMGIEASRDMTADLKRQADTFGAWAFGDCYGFAVESPDGETLDSIWGFVGSDFDESGLSESAIEIADSILDNAEHKRRDKLKELIRARVPVAYRPAILAEAGKLESCF